MATNEMPKAYDFKTTEARLYQWWEENGWFKPECRPNSAEPFVISIPPPNVTGYLHVGHAMFVSLEDMMIRRARMQGYAALWVPGTDHAGIATQLQVEKHLRATQNKSRQEVGREKFLEAAWAWKNEYGGRIIEQMRSMGASCDWDRLRFTLDEGLSEAVLEAFVRLHRIGLLYRGEYLVNWSPGLQTAVSDLEVEFVETNGFLYHFNYPVEGGGFIPVATTRPETILGDTAVAVHPEDERYQALIGKMALVPMLNRPIPIIADSYVDRAFGTGALKITPAHDHNDYEIGKRHQLEIINIMNKDATINENGGSYQGLDRFVCRKQLWADMENIGLVIKVDPHVHQLPISQRGGEVTEPMISKQWYVNVEPMATMALEAVRSGRIEIIPERFNKIWENWLTNIRPWCISRQLWWGHRIPVWYVNGNEADYIVAKSEEEAYKIARRQYGEAVQLEQDPDVLDTWFSSGLWPFSTLGWPHDTADLRRFYPTTVMETGHDILFFWVARMVMQGLLYTNDVPFKTVYLHGLVRDEKGRKMSKSLGNVVDPLGVTAEYGTDALRFTLLTGGSPGTDLNLSLERVASNRNFANKLWNVTRFIVGNLEKSTATRPINDEDAPLTTADQWILSQLHQITAEANRLIDQWQLGEAGRQVYDFLWGEFADWYVEIAKTQLAAGGARAWRTFSVLRQVLDDGLRLLHPYIPFVTEETWQGLKSAFVESGLGIEPTEGWSEALMIATWPQAHGELSAESQQLSADFERLREVVRAIRATRSEYQLPPSKFIPALIVAGDKAAFLNQERTVLSFLARLDDQQLQIVESAEPEGNVVTISLGDYTCYLPLAGLVDISKEQVRLEKELTELTAQIGRLTQLLEGGFAQKAPAHIVEKEREKLALLQASSQELQERLAVLTGQK